MVASLRVFVQKGTLFCIVTAFYTIEKGRVTWTIGVYCIVG